MTEEVMTSPTRVKFGYRPLKRILDLMIALSIAPVVFFVGLLVACFIKLSSKGPILFKQNRVGYEGRYFGCYKFRTMRVDAEERLKHLLTEDEKAAQEWQETQKLREDPRVTSLGRLLRKTSLDELPQLINVIKGDMSFVGPRPIVRDEITRYGKDFIYYEVVKPGITGLWQVSGRSDTTYKERVAFDKEYALNQGLLLDVKILLKTIPVILKKSGAY